MTEDQGQAWRQQWERALAARNAQQRRQRYRPRARGGQAVTKAAMIRLPVSERPARPPRASTRKGS